MFAARWTPPPRLRDMDLPPMKLERPSLYGGFTVAAPKAPEPVRDESYRRLVASLPCFNCGIEGHSQAAHPNTGKAKGKKASDITCFPMCATRPGEKGCHARFDQYELVSRETMPEFERRAIEWTRKQLLETACT